MPHPLTTAFGGPYEAVELEVLLSEKSLINFYYWLGNEYTPETPFTKSQYQSAVCRQKSYSYTAYVDSVEGRSDKIIKLLAECEYKALLEAIELVGGEFRDLTIKYNQLGLLVVTLASMKIVFGQVNGSANIYRALTDLNSQKEGGKLLKFDRNPEKYLTIYGAPHGLSSNVHIEKLDLAQSKE
jgi:hypothetical protein